MPLEAQVPSSPAMNRSASLNVISSYKRPRPERCAPNPPTNTPHSSRGSNLQRPASLNCSGFLFVADHFCGGSTVV